MNEKQIIWTSKKLAELVGVIVPLMPLDVITTTRVLDKANEIIQQSKNNKEVAKAVMGILEVFDLMLQEKEK